MKSIKVINKKFEHIRREKVTKNKLGYFTYVKSRSDNNEDTFLFVNRRTTKVFVLCDGMGGHINGGAASKLVVDEFEKALGGKKTISIDLILSTVEKANEKIMKQYPEAGTTLCIAYLKGKTCTFINVGDSVSLLVNDIGELIYKSIEFSPPGLLYYAGDITEDELLTHKDKHIIDNFLGKKDYKVEVSAPFQLQEGFQVCLFSDGLRNRYPIDNIVHFFYEDYKGLDLFNDDLVFQGQTLEDDLTFMNYRLGK